MKSDTGWCKRLESGLGHAVFELFDSAELFRDGDTRQFAGTESVTAAPVALPQVFRDSVQGTLDISAASFPASLSVHDVVTEIGESHRFEVIVVNIELVIQFVGLHMLEHFGGDAAEVLGNVPFFSVLDVQAFVGFVSVSAREAIDGGSASGRAVEAARAHVARVQSRALVVPGARFFGVSEDRCVHWDAKVHHHIAFQAISAASIALAVQSSDFLSLDQVHEVVHNRGRVPVPGARHGSRTESSGKATKQDGNSQTSHFSGTSDDVSKTKSKKK